MFVPALTTAIVVHDLVLLVLIIIRVISSAFVSENSNQNEKLFYQLCM